MTAIDNVTFSFHTADDVAPLLDELCEVYADAYGHVPGEDSRTKTTAFHNRATAALGANNYLLVTARTEGQLVGFVFGYSLRPDRGWWEGLTPEPPEGFTIETGSRTVVLAEIEVRQAWQGQGIGRALQDAFLSRRTEERATLASSPANTQTLARYQHWGWQRMGLTPGKPGAYYREYVLMVLPLPSADERR
jgi:GNAT superfamily N-acetyltransferase